MLTCIVSSSCLSGCISAPIAIWVPSSLTLISDTLIIGEGRCKCLGTVCRDYISRRLFEP
ncbi:hypothetical protein KC19_4G245000 [Ceratodon purpureus]|uniref:Uncharacterized protein n=1 Tax=Ceratodon purpureus TaxID=3225 RepID=A0A8T0IEP9_CERPU|nr:hypothetical protein KC19_4G245000 [Ceratodon purpureus]